MLTIIEDDAGDEVANERRIGQDGILSCAVRSMSKCSQGSQLSLTRINGDAKQTARILAP
jgi:hypothetical protein